MNKKLFVISFMVCFCVVIFSTFAFAKERSCPLGVKVDIPNEYQLDEEDEDSIFFTSESSMSMIMIGVVKLEAGQKLDKAMKKELLDTICNDKDIDIEYENNEKIGNKQVYVMTGILSIDDETMKAYIYVFQLKNKVVFSLCVCPLEDTKREKIFDKIIESIY